MTKNELINQLTGLGLFNQDISIPVKFVVEMVSQLDDDVKPKQPVVNSFVTEMNYRGQSKDLCSEIVSELTNNTEDIINDYELDLRGREIEVTDISFNERSLQDIILHSIETWFEGKLEDHKNEVEEDIEG